jgi:hypothetical protein
MSLGLHGATLLLVGALLGYQIHRRHDTRWSALLLVLVGAAGPFGAALGLLTALMFGVSVRFAAPFMEWFSSLFPEEGSSLGKRVFDRIRAGHERASEQPTVEPFRDILMFGSFVQKQAALVKMTLHFQPAFVPLLRLALNDTDNAVRVQAATAIAKIERDYLQRGLGLEKEHLRSPNNVQTLLRFARFCEEYADCGIADALGRETYRKKAISLYALLQDKTGIALESDTALGRLYSLTGEAERACFHFERALPEDRTAAPELLKHYAEALYRMKAFARLRKLAARYPDDPSLAPWAATERATA